MFEGNCEKKRMHQRNFANRCAQRCSLEITYARKVFNGDVSLMQAHLAHTQEAIIQCLQGQHNLCKTYSFVCKVYRKWSCYVDIHPTAGDIACIRASLSYRLAPENVAKCSRNYTTQKAESINHSLRSCLPKGLLFKRNAIGRVSSMIHRINNRLDQTLPQQLQRIGLNINNRCSKLKVFLKSLKSSIEYDKLRKQSYQYRLRRAQLCAEHHRSFNDRNKEALASTSYARGLLDPFLMQQAIQSVKNMHNYVKDIGEIQGRIHMDHQY